MTRRTLAVALLLWAAPAAAQPARIYVAAEGETLRDVARLYPSGLTAADLVRWNRVDAEWPLAAGAHICLEPCGDAHTLDPLAPATDCGDTTVIVDPTWEEEDAMMETETMMEDIVGENVDLGEDAMREDGEMIADSAGAVVEIRPVLDVTWGDVRLVVRPDGSDRASIELSSPTDGVWTGATVPNLRAWAEAVQRMSLEPHAVGSADEVRLSRTLDGAGLVVSRSITPQGNRYWLHMSDHSAIEVDLTPSRLRSLLVDLRAAADAVDEEAESGGM